MRVSKKHSSHEINLLGVAAEYVCWRMIGGYWYRYSKSGTDPGWEIIKNGITFQVKGNHYDDGSFYMGEKLKMKADYGLLVIKGPGIHYSVAGIISRSKYHRLRTLKTWGGPPVLAVTQDQMDDPRPFFQKSAPELLGKMSACGDDDDNPFDWDPHDDFGDVDNIQPPGQLTGEVYED
jgi:hypothetical protein